MTAALALVRAIRARGAELRVSDGKLKVRPRSVVLDLESEILRRADELAAVLEPKAPVLILDQAEPDHQAYAFRVVVDELEPAAASVELRPGARAVDVPRAIESLLLDLAVEARRYIATREGGANGRGGDDQLDRIGELVHDLRNLGAHVRVVEVQ